MVRNLWDALGEIEDRRGRQGRHYALRSILGIAVAAMVAGSNNLLPIFRWGRRLKPEALKLFGIASGRAPCHATYRYFFQGLDGEALARVRMRPGISPSTARLCAEVGGSTTGLCMFCRPSRPFFRP